MNQVDLYKQTLEIEDQITKKQGEILNLRSKLKDLPYCPCCPSNTKGEVCMIDFLRRKDADIDHAAKAFGISKDHLVAAVNCEYTLTEEEFGGIIDFLNKQFKP